MKEGEKMYKLGGGYVKGMLTLQIFFDEHLIIKLTVIMFTISNILKMHILLKLCFLCTFVHIEMLLVLHIVCNYINT